MDKNKLMELIREAINEVLNENQPATKPKPTEKPGPAVAPKEKPGTGKPEPSRRIGAPNKMPKKTPAKAQEKNLNEEEMLQKIVQRFKSKK